MNSPTNLSPLRRRTVSFIVLLISLLVLSTVRPASTAQSAAQEREFKNTIPEHVPIRVKLRNEQSFKRKENKNWARELEIEVKNTGSKPIYYLYVIVVMADMLIEGNALTFTPTYGRRELAYIETPVQPDDVPILPGESITLKIPESHVRAYESVREEQKRPDPQKIELDLQIINFGDGTGLRGRVGRPYLLRKQTRGEARPQRAPTNCSPAPKAGEASLSERLLKAFYSPTPASILRADFSLPEELYLSSTAKTARISSAKRFEVLGCRLSRVASRAHIA